MSFLLVAAMPSADYFAGVGKFVKWLVVPDPDPATWDSLAVDLRTRTVHGAILLREFPAESP